MRQEGRWRSDGGALPAALEAVGPGRSPLGACARWPASGPPSPPDALNQSQSGIYICGVLKIVLGATVRLFNLNLKDGSAPLLNLLLMHISPWL